MDFKLNNKLSPLSAHFGLFICFFAPFSFHLCKAQNPTIDPSEVAALNSLFMQWDVKASEAWNISGEPCSGSATAINGSSDNPGIRCDCTYNKSTTCHITQLSLVILGKHGVIPEEILAFKYLTVLNIDQNYFTGPLPAFIGNLSLLTFLAIAWNSFYGTIPKELGNLKNLTVLSIGGNNFGGTLPPEMGNLVNLERMFINSCGLSGEIPSTFAQLQRLTHVLANDNSFSGKIPEFMGNWTRLQQLQLQGNSFEGPIPSSFSKLVSLTFLRISDLYKGSSKLDFIRNLMNLSSLNLRNALITDTIPYNIGKYQNLKLPDLSFNNVTGEIPSSLFNMINLISLFLGNNSLSGELPSQKSDTLQTIDLSYNYLSGSFPSWVSSNISNSPLYDPSNLQLNLAANNFTFNTSDKSDLQGLNSLQRNFPCNRNTPHYAKFSINCGGPEESSDDGIVFEAEDKSVGAASFHVTSSEEWAVSNAGLFVDREGNPQIPEYAEKSSTQVTGTDIPKLYQTSRISASSLRYYGLGLQNGVYTVSLFFAVVNVSKSTTVLWKFTPCQRVFDIYIQGSLKLKDFNISKEAGGIEKAIPKNFSINITQNYLEIHLFWAGKGTCIAPAYDYYGPAISALSVVPDFPDTQKKKSTTGLMVGVIVSVGLVCLILFLVFLYIKRKKNNQEEDEEVLRIGLNSNTLSYAELRTATEDFSLLNKLGEGGFGLVYKGLLYDGREVAVKQLSVESSQGTSQFLAEITTISAVQHRNLVRLYGCCFEGNKCLLVYEYLQNKSLDKALFGKSNNLELDWKKRFNICVGIARGLAYLHEESRPRIVHRDVKASNILLDAELCPKISDFGLAKLYDDDKTHISTRIAGTIGYLAPEYAMRGHLTEKTDIFGFGIVALETLSGRPNIDNSLAEDKVYLLEWAWTLHESNQSLALVDPNLSNFDENEALKVIGVAFLCTQASPVMRPTMSRVVSMLAGDIEVNIAAITKPSYLTDWDFKDITCKFSSKDT